MSGGSSNNAPTADPGISSSAKRQTELAEEYLSFVKEEFSYSKSMQEEQQKLAKEVSDTFLSMAKEDRERWNTVFKPLEDQFIKEATEYDTPERQEQAAASARADVQSAAATEREAMERRNASMGIRPDSGAYAGLDRAASLGTALGSVDAQNRARETVRQTGREMRAQAIGLGRDLKSQASSYLANSLNASTVPINTHTQSIGIMNSGYSNAQGGYNSSGSTLNSLYKNQLSAYSTDQEYKAANNAGWMKLAGTGAGLIFSSKKAKTNRKEVAEGDSLKAVERMPVETYDYKPGVGDGGSHVGPMAEDFAAATGKGDGNTIKIQDAIGIAFGAIKDVSAKVDRLSEAIGLGGNGPRRTAMA